MYGNHHSRLIARSAPHILADSAILAPHIHSPMEEAHISTTLALPRLRKFGLHPFAAHALRRQYKQHFLVYSLRLINLLVQLLPARWPVPLQLAAAKSQSAPAYISSSAYQLPSRVNSLSLPLVQKPPVRSRFLLHFSLFVRNLSGLSSIGSTFLLRSNGAGRVRRPDLLVRSRSHAFFKPSLNWATNRATRTVIMRANIGRANCRPSIESSR